MKILMTSETFLPAIGGAEIHIKNLLDQLKNEKHEVILITNQSGEFQDGILRLAWSKVNVLSIILSLWEKSKGCDVIHAHYSYRLAFLVGVIGLIRKIPVVVTLHGLGTLDPAQASLYTQLKHSFYRYFSLNLATKIISTSEDLAVVVYKYIPKEKVVIIMNGYDSTSFNTTSTQAQNLFVEKFENKKIILTVRRLVPKNGIHYLIEAMPFVIKSNPNVHYIIVGDGPLREKIKERIEANKLESYVTLLGIKDNSEVPSYLSMADVVIFPSTAESSSIACAEAMGMAKMVVASRVGGLIELIGRNNERGILVSLVPWEGSNYDAPDTLSLDRYELLAESILSALEPSQENEQRKINAYNYATQELSWGAITKRTLEVYQAVYKK